MKLKQINGLFFFLPFILLFFSTSLAAYPNLSDYPIFMSPEIYIVVGGEGSAVDVLSSTEIATSIKGELPAMNVETKLDSDVVNPYGISRNFLLIGSPCTNKLVALIMGKDYPSCGSETEIPENSAIIKIYDGFTPGYYVIIVSGWNDSYTRTAASVLKNHKQYLSDKSVKAVKVISESLSDVMPYDDGEFIPTLDPTITTLSIDTTSFETTATILTTTTENRNIATTYKENITTSTTIPIGQNNKPKIFDISIMIRVIIGLAVLLILAILSLFLFKRK